MSTSNRSRATRRPLLLVAGGLVAALACAAPGLGAPAISGADGDVWNAANREPDYTITGESRRSRIFWLIPGVASGEGRSPLRIRRTGLADGSYQLIAADGVGRRRGGDRGPHIPG